MRPKTPRAPHGSAHPQLKIAFYCPNKPLNHPHPSGDLTIARGIVAGLQKRGHRCREMVRFRSRWFWHDKQRVLRALGQVFPTMLLTFLWKPDLWLTYHSYYKTPDLFGPWMAGLLRIPYVLVQPMFSTKRLRDPRTRLGFYLNLWALRRADLAVTNNLNDFSDLQRIIPSNRLLHMPPGIDPAAFPEDFEAGLEVRRRLGIPRHHLVLLTVARFRKGVKYRSLRFLFESLGRIDSRKQPFWLVVVGDGPMERQVRQAAESSLTSRVVFAGAVSRSRLFAYYSCADIFTFPGIGETLGMVYLEAQCCGLPVVALREGGIAQVVDDGVTGMLVPRKDPLCYAQSVEKLMMEENLRRRMGTAARHFILQQRNLHRNSWILWQALEACCRHPGRR